MTVTVPELAALESWTHNTWAAPSWSRLEFVPRGRGGVVPHIVPRGVPKRLCLDNLTERYGHEAWTNTTPTMDEKLSRGFIDVGGCVFTDIKWVVTTMPTGHLLAYYPGHADGLLYALEKARFFSGLCKIYGRFNHLVIPSSWCEQLRVEFTTALAESEALHEAVAQLADGSPHLQASRPHTPRGDT